jgi:hypothetical protein
MGQLAPYAGQRLDRNKAGLERGQRMCGLVHRQNGQAVGDGVAEPEVGLGDAYRLGEAPAARHHDYGDTSAAD